MSTQSSTVHWLAALVLGAVLACAGPGPAHAQAPVDRTLELERIEVEPSTRELVAAVGDLLGLRTGDAITADELVAARRRLQLSGWFDSVEVYTRRGTRPGAVVLHVDVDLDERARVETGLEHEPIAGWAFTVIGVRAHHALGPASTARVGWKLGPRRSMLEADAEMRRLGGSRFDLLLNAHVGGEVWYAYVGEDLYEQSINRGALRLGMRSRLTPHWTAVLWGGSSWADPNEVEPGEDVETEAPDGLVGSLRDREDYQDLALHLTYDRRDLVQPWRRGLWTTFRVHGSTSETRTAFWGAHTALRGAVPLPREQALALRFDAEWSDPGTPYHLRPVFGGQGTVRGFGDASLSGGRGARGMIAAALEWRTPILPRGASDPRVTGALFFDTGTWIDADGESHDWASSAGWGVRVRVPWIGSLSFDVALPLTPTATGDAFWVHGGLGFGF